MPGDKVNDKYSDDSTSHKANSKVQKFEFLFWLFMYRFYLPVFDLKITFQSFYDERL